MNLRYTLRNHGLSLVLAALFLVTLIAQWLTGWCTSNADQLVHGGATLSVWQPGFLRYDARRPTP